MKMIKLMVIITLIICSGIVSVFPDAGDVVPGQMALGFRLGMTQSEVRSVKKGEPRIVSLDRSWSLFKELLGVDENWEILFDSAWYYDTAALVFRDGRVVGIIVLEPKMLRNGRSAYSRGVNYVVLLYGNQGLDVKRKGQHSFYGYPEKGIAMLDDNSDDTVDIIVICNPGR